MSIRVLTPRDRRLLITAMEVVAEEMAKGNARPGVLYRIKDDLTKRWEGFDVDEVIQAMERGWNKGRGWEEYSLPAPSTTRRLRKN